MSHFHPPPPPPSLPLSFKSLFAKSKTNTFGHNIEWLSCARIVFSSEDLSMRLVRIVWLPVQLSAATLFSLMTNTAPEYVPWLLAPHIHLIILYARCSMLDASLLPFYLLFRGFLSFFSRFVFVVFSLILFVLLVMCCSLAATIRQQQLNLVRLHDSVGLFYCRLPLQSLITFGFFFFVHVPNCHTLKPNTRLRERDVCVVRERARARVLFYKWGLALEIIQKMHTRARVRAHIWE